MFKAIDTSFFEQFNVDPGTALGKFFDFQRAGLDAAREIADNNIRAISQVGALRNPQDFLAGQQALAEQNIAVLTRLFQPALDEAAATAKAAKAVRKAV